MSQFSSIEKSDGLTVFVFGFDEGWKTGKTESTTSMNEVSAKNLSLLNLRLKRFSEPTLNGKNHWPRPSRAMSQSNPGHHDVDFDDGHGFELRH